MSSDGFLDIGGTRLEYRLLGRSPDETLTLVFLHHGLGSVSTWKDFPDRLVAETRLGGLIYSRAGYGRSDPVEVPRPLTFMDDEARLALSRVLDEAGVRRAVLIGHSDGGTISALYAANSGDRRVLGLVLMAPHFFNEDVCVATAAAIKEEYAAGDLRERLARHHDHVDIAFRGWNDAWLDPGFRDWDITDQLHRIPVPILAIQGEDDQYGTLAQLDALDAVSSPVERLVLADCGHSPQVDQPDATAAAIVEFVNRLGF